MVWGRLWKLLRREGAAPMVTSMVYRSVAQTVIISGMETWVISEIMENKVKVTQTGFMRQIMGKR